MLAQMINVDLLVHHSILSDTLRQLGSLDGSGFVPVVESLEHLHFKFGIDLTQSYTSREPVKPFTTVVHGIGRLWSSTVQIPMSMQLSVAMG